MSSNLERGSGSYLQRGQCSVLVSSHLCNAYLSSLTQSTARLLTTSTCLFRTAGRFEVHCDTPEHLIECPLDAQLRQINDIKMYGRTESYIFASGVWKCTGLCRLVSEGDVVSLATRGPCLTGPSTNQDMRAMSQCRATQGTRSVTRIARTPICAETIPS